MLERRQENLRSGGAAAVRSAESLEVEAAAAGDEDAFAVLYRRYLAPLYRYLAARAASPEEAADLVQAVYLKAYQGLPRYREGEAGFAPWLFRIARNTATDASRRRRPPGSPWFAEAASLAAVQSPEHEALLRERNATLHAAIAALTRDQQELLALRYAAGLSSREIGVVVGKSEAAAKKQLSRTLIRLKETYRDDLPPHRG
jgi:RNA polymerase sigma-70 factor (ECF subfamily)